MDIPGIREDFPILDRRINGQPLAYLDNAATTQKPRAVTDAITEFYERHNANPHRSPHTLSADATDAYHRAHRTVADFINADDWHEIVFTKNTTESINLLAYSYGMSLDADDEIVLSAMEHHSNLVPWQHVADCTGATLRFVDITDDGELDMEDLRNTLTQDTAIVAVPHVSNVLGCINPVTEITEIAHDVGAKCFIDGAQAAPHMPVDVQAIGCDAYAFSGHKMCGPTGIGVLYGKKAFLEVIEPFLRGGDMISRVSQRDAEWNEVPWKFGAGTPNTAGALGLAAAIEYLEDIGMTEIENHGRNLAQYTAEKLSEIDGLTTFGPQERIGLVSFALDTVHPHDVSTLLDQHGIAVRAGHHCAQPLTERLGISATTRASTYIYNTEDEIDRLGEALADVVEMFA